MPKVKTCSFKIKGTEFTANLNVSSKGVFSIRRPGVETDWAGQSMTIEGATLEAVESQWRLAVQDLVERSKTTRKVLIVRFDSKLRPDGRKNFFNNESTMLILKCCIAEETTMMQGGKENITYRYHEDNAGFGKPPQPFPCMMNISEGELQHAPRTDDWTVVDWSQELEDTLIRACTGITQIVHMLHRVLETPETLKLAAQTLTLLPAPQNEIAR